MPPQEAEKPPFQSSIGLKYPAHRDHPFRCADLWIEDKRADDGAEGLWRIHDDLYDLSDWIDKHPGGRDWIRLTKGTDITIAFESYHISTQAESMLPKFFIRKATLPRNLPYTFDDDGFFKVLKRRVRNSLENIPEYPATKSKIMTDLLLVGYVITALIAIKAFSFLFALLSGILLALTTVAAHNFFHQKDNFRMYYFDLSGLSSREWRISHAMSHHLYTNTVHDLEMSLVEPFLLYLPAPDSIFRRITSWVVSPFLHMFLFSVSLIKRYLLTMIGVIKEVNKTEVLPFLVPTLMYILGGRTFIETIIIWLVITLTGSFYFGFIGLSAGHHHPENFHDGDTPREDKDWGAAQLDAVMDRNEITGSPFLVLVSFGDHALHHMFPTIDHGKLNYLYPALRDTCKEFGVEFRMRSQLEMITGQYWQLMRAIPNPLPPGQKWKWHPMFSFKIKNKSL